MADEDAHRMEYSRVTENIYIGSDLCEGGVCPIHGAEFEKLGVSCEINLEAERREVPPKDIEMYVWIPVADGAAPTMNQMAYGSAIIHEAAAKKKTVYVHCKNGHGRSPTMVAAYLIRYRRCGVEEAIELIKKKRAEVHLEEIQMKVLEEFAALWK